MNRSRHSVKMIAGALVAVVLVALLVPLCLMSECANATTAACSDFKPACDDCPPRMVMKHTRDEASGTTALALPAPVMVATVAALASPDVSAVALALPEVTSSPPPPLDPLGVRLTI